MLSPPMFTLGGLTMAEGLNSQPLVTSLPAKQTLREAALAKASTTSPITWLTTRGSLSGAMEMGLVRVSQSSSFPLS